MKHLLTGASFALLALGGCATGATGSAATGTAGPIMAVQPGDDTMGCAALLDEISRMDQEIANARAAYTGSQTAQVGATTASRAGRYGGYSDAARVFQTLSGSVQQGAQMSASQARQRESEATARRQRMMGFYQARGCSAQ
ncbi:hypothetical protein [Henriciella sp.]|uniref:hypothetical protein n=1 Tax=Henriciella sp. TaxID=1968823 RepID=UPI002618EFC8|nr:hypothetical protein [Henriciella sp.]